MGSKSHDALRRSNAQLKELGTYLQGVYQQVESTLNEEMAHLHLLKAIAKRQFSQENNMTSNDRLSMLAPCIEIVPMPRFARPVQ